MSDSDFNIEKQKLLIEFMLIDESIFQRCHNILKANYFDKELQPIVKCILKHSKEFNILPTTKQIYAETGFSFDVTDKIRTQDQDWALKNIERFCQRGAIIQAVMKSPDFIEQNNYGAVESLVKEAVTVGLQKDLGVDYFYDPRQRLERMRVRDLIPTGWHDIDKKLYGGLNRGEITVFCGGSGMGKSLFLQNLCLNWVEGPSKLYDGKETKHDPLVVIYITLELSEELTSKRLDTMVTGIDAREIFKRIDEVEMKVALKGKKCSHLRVKYMPGGSTTNDIRAYLKEFEIQTGLRPDALVVDYLDLLHPNSRRINPGDLFIKDKYITEELRTLAAEYDILCVTASQLNRSAVDEAEHSQAMIAGGLSKIQTADNVVSIYASHSMRERGEYQCQFLKTRSSSGVGSKVLLGFDLTNLRIFNLDEEYKPVDQDDQDNSLRNQLGTQDQLLQKIKRQVPPIGITQRPMDNQQEQPKLDLEESTDPECKESNQKPETDPVESPTDRLKRLQSEKKIL